MPAGYWINSVARFQETYFFRVPALIQDDGGVHTLAALLASLFESITMATTSDQAMDRSATGEAREELPICRAKTLFQAGVGADSRQLRDKKRISCSSFLMSMKFFETF